MVMLADINYIQIRVELKRMPFYIFNMTNFHQNIGTEIRNMGNIDTTQIFDRISDKCRCPNERIYILDMLREFEFQGNTMKRMINETAETE